jgi:hypothetical protein
MFVVPAYVVIQEGEEGIWVEAADANAPQR